MMVGILMLLYYQIRINIDTTVQTVYGKQQGARKGHNTQHRGKEGLRPIMCVSVIIRPMTAP
jgi:hypothetical protein